MKVGVREPNGSEYAAELLEMAADMAKRDPGRAGVLAVEAAGSLDGVERHVTLVTGAQLLANAGRWVNAASAWWQAADAAADDETRARDLSRCGNAARQAGRWGAAETAHRQAVELATRACGASSSQAAAASHDLAVTLKYTGGFDEAERLYRHALEVATSAGNTSFAATICHNLGGVAHARGTPAEGVPWARRGLQLRIDAGADPLATAEDQGALAALLIDVAAPDEAEELLLTCRATFAEHLGAEHLEVAIVDGNLATLALQRGDLDTAERHARNALSGKSATLGPEHPQLGSTLTTLGTIRRRRGEHAEATALHQRALDVLTPHVEDDHPLLTTIRANLELAAAGQAEVRRSQARPRMGSSTGMKA